MKRLWPAWLAAAALFAVLFAMFYFLGRHPGGERSGLVDRTAWQRMASPGDLSAAHVFLEHDCNACHTPVTGAEPAKCIACHASQELLLARQPTAFHATIGSCRECHLEHQGFEHRPTQMDHAALAEIGLRQLANDERSPGSHAGKSLNAWMQTRHAETETPSGLPTITRLEMLLDCASCHAKEDPHLKQFGRDCAQCHGTAGWAIPAFRHPSPRSRDCSQCHVAPPSHYMGHFHMVSAMIAGKPHAEVTQCYLCHQTTAWNDIQGVGWYKHH